MSTLDLVHKVDQLKEDLMTIEEQDMRYQQID